MNTEDKFECRHQEIHDENTGVTVTFGSHVGSGNKWVRLAVPYGNPDNPLEPGETKTSTIIFGANGEVSKIVPHMQAPKAKDPHDQTTGSEGDGTAAMQAGAKHDSADEVDKSSKRGKK